MFFKRRKLDAKQAGVDPVEGLTPAEALARLDAAYRRKTFRATVSVPAVLAVWLIAGAYYAFTPPTYISKWTLILPVSNSSSTVSLDQVGQTSVTPGQTFGSISLSPKVIYREIADSEQVRRAAAARLQLPSAMFGRVRVRLIDETSLMLFQMSGSTPESALQRAQAHLASFNAQLEVLRRDESERRASVVRDGLKQYQVNLDAARERILEFQRKTGFLSVNQFNESISSNELIRRKLADLRADLHKLESQQAATVARVGLRPAAALAGLKLASDPAFARLATSYADANAQMHEVDRLYGPEHPARAAIVLKLDGAIAELEKLTRRLDVNVGTDLRRLVLLVNSSHQSEMLNAMVVNETQIEGRRKEIATLEVEAVRLDGEVLRLSTDAGRFEYLKKDQLLAESVYTSAAARLDINRTDHFSSYPMVQVLSEPDTPVERSQPQLLLAFAGGIAGTILVLLAWGAAWFRASFGRKR